MKSHAADQISVVCVNFANREAFEPVLTDWIQFLGSRPGEICVVGPAVFVGYLDNDEANAKAFRNGWFCTGPPGVGVVRRCSGGASFINAPSINAPSTASGERAALVPCRRLPKALRPQGPSAAERAVHASRVGRAAPRPVR